MGTPPFRSMRPGVPSKPEASTVRRTVPTCLLPILLAAALSACSVVEAPKQIRGNRVDNDQLKELVPGTSTRADATSLLGSPTAKATFDDNTWIYIGETTKTRVARSPGIIQQDVVVLSFDAAGVLRGVKRLNQNDGRDVSVVARATPSPGSEASFMQQLLGNVGKFNTGLPGGGGKTPGGSGASSDQGL